jgi:hypothetical protein
MGDDVGYNWRPELLKDILPISFPHLAKLLLVGNQIDSIDGLHQLVMPSLKEIDLSIAAVTKATTKYRQSAPSGSAPALCCPPSP